MKRISTKILIMLMAVILVTTTIIGVSVNLKVKDTLEEQTIEQLSTLADGLVKRVNLVSSNIEQLIGVINALPDVQASVDSMAAGDLNPDQQATTNNLLKDFQASVSDITEVVFIADQEGNVVLDSVDGAYNGIQIAERSYFTSAIAGTPMWSEVLISKGTGNPITVYAIPITTSDGTVTGVLASAINWAAITTPVAEVKAGESGYAFMLDAKGLVLQHPKEEKILVDNLLETPEESLTSQVEKMIAMESGYGYYVYEGIEKINVYRPLGQWTMAITIPIDEVFAPVTAMTNYIVIVSFIAVLLTAAVALWITRSIAKPIVKMKEAMVQASKGHLDHDIKNTRSDEIGQLSEGLINLLGTLKSKREQVKAIAMGDLEVTIEPTSDSDTLGLALVDLKENLLTINHDIGGIITSTERGLLDDRIDTSRYHGAWQEMLSGINNVLQAYNEPIQLTKEYLNCLSVGDVPAVIEKEFYGDFNEIKQSINGLIIALSHLVDETKDFIDKAVDGQLSYRADVKTFKGEYQAIIAGMNSIMDAVVTPIEEASDVLSSLSQGNLKVRVSGNYNGDHATIKDSLNHTMQALEAYIDEMSSVLGAMGAKDLSARIRGDFQGDFVAIKRAVNTIASQLSEVIQEIDEAASQVRIGAASVAQASESLAQGATEQASSVAQISESMREISEQTQSNASHAKTAAEETLQISKHANDGNESMTDLLTAMRDIDDASKRISSIIKVIDEIAFQTNILALNAAVEAARAGEHGKGFAVVAEEVRNLASRSAGAAKDTTALIDQTGDVVARGMNIASDTADQLVEIVKQIELASDKVSQIAQQSEKQSKAIQEINIGVDQVERVTHMNSSAAEESAATSQEMSSQADLLKEMVGQFRVNARSLAIFDNEDAM